MNIVLTNSARFNPYTFDEMLKPLAMATLAYQDLENQYTELATKLSVWEGMANELTDPYAYNMYKTFANDLEEKANQLAKEGLTPTSRQNMLNMRQRYSRDIVPIEQAYKRRQELIDEQRKALMANPSLMYDVDFSMTSLDDLISNPNLSYTPVSGDDLYKKGKEAAVSASSRNINIGSSLQGQYWAIKQGYGAEAANRFLLENDSIPELKDAVNRIVSQSKVTDTNKARAIDYVISGIMSGLSYKESYQTNRGYVNPNEGGKPRNPTGGLALNPSNIYSSRELSKEEKLYNDNIRKFSNYFYTDAQGRTRLSKEGMDEYRRNVAQKTTSAGSGSGTARLMNVETQMQNDSRFAPTEFKKFMDSIGMNPKQGDIDNFNDVAIGSLWKKYVNEAPAAKTARYDATKTSEYIYDVPQSPTYQQDYKAKLSRVIGSTEEFKEVDYDSKSNQWVPTGETLSFADFDTDNYNVTARAPSELGTTLFIKKKGGKAKRYLAPPGINITAEGGRDQAISEMLSTQRMLQNPNLTQQQREKLEKHYDNLAQQQIMFESQLDLTNSTKTQDINPYYIP